MPVPATIPAALFSSRDDAKAFASACILIDLAGYVTDERAAGRVPKLTKVEVDALRAFAAEGAPSPVATLDMAIAHLSALGGSVDPVRLVAMDGQTLPDMTAQERARLTVSIPKSTPAERVADLKEARNMLRMENHARMVCRRVATMRARWQQVQRAGFAVAIREHGAHKNRTPGKRLESSMAALLTADPTRLEMVLRASGLPDDVIGAMCAHAAAAQTRTTETEGEVLQAGRLAHTPT